MDRAAAVGLARPVVESVVWCTLATVAPDGTPRTRVVHPLWDWDEGTGWVTSRPTPLRRRHLAHQPAVSCAYWSPAHDVAYLDCRARWVPDAARRAVWDRCTATPEPMGFDPAPMFPGGPDDDGFAPIELVPFRVRVSRAADAARGVPADLWVAGQHDR